MQPYPPRINTGALHHSQLPAAADIDAETLLTNPTGHGRTQERLGGVVDIPTLEGSCECPSSRPQVGFIHHVNRCADLFGNLDHAQAGHTEHASCVLVDTGAPQAWQQCVDVAGNAQPARGPRGGVGVDRAGHVGMSHIAELCQTRSTSRRFFSPRTSVRGAKTKP